MNKLRAQQLAKIYSGRKVVSDVSLEVASGEVVGLLGPNGAGKTTSFYMIVGLVTPDHGEIFLDDLNVTYEPMHQRARLGIGYLPQEASIFRKLSVEDNIMAVLQLKPELGKEECHEKMDSLLEEFQVSHIRKNLGMTLSGGERRRVEIARALANDPKYILLDEPFAGVDPISVSEIKAIIRHLRERGLGVLITDHHVRETLDVCERAYIVGEGKIIATGTLEQILNNQQVKKTYLGEDFKI